MNVIRKGGMEGGGGGGGAVNIPLIFQNLPLPLDVPGFEALTKSNRYMYLVLHLIGIQLSILSLYKEMATITSFINIGPTILL